MRTDVASSSLSSNASFRSRTRSSFRSPFRPPGQPSATRCRVSTTSWSTGCTSTRRGSSDDAERSDREDRFVTRYLIGRLLQGLLVLLVISILAFVMTRLVPGDPALVLLGSQHATPQ